MNAFICLTTGLSLFCSAIPLLVSLSHQRCLDVFVRFITWSPGFVCVDARQSIFPFLSLCLILLSAYYLKMTGLTTSVKKQLKDWVESQEPSTEIENLTAQQHLFQHTQFHLWDRMEVPNSQLCSYKLDTNSIPLWISWRVPVLVVSFSHPLLSNLYSSPLHFAAIL